MNLKETRKEMEKLCVCRQCPSFVDCTEGVAYCLAAKARSLCIKDQRGCMCGGCMAQKQMGFEHNYYCVLGPEKDQS